MKLLHSPTSKRPLKPASGFSLVEVTLALGIIAFCMIPLLGLLPTGLDAQRKAQESARAAVAVNLLATAVRSAQFVSRDATTGAATYRFPQFFSDSSTPATNPTTVTAGGAVSTRVYAILEDGSIRKSNDTTPARQTMFVQTFPPATDAQLQTPPAGNVAPSAAIRVYVYVTWPASSADTPTVALSSLKNRQGAVESFITYVPNY